MSTAIKSSKERLRELLDRPHIVVVDWDGTLVEQAWPDRPTEWLPGAKEALRALLDAGLTVRIHSTRYHELDINEVDPNPTRDEEIAYIRGMLDSAGFTDVPLIMDSKPSATFYVDDKAIRFNGNWAKIVRQIKAGVK